jgi:hypothetical protein
VATPKFTVEFLPAAERDLRKLAKTLGRAEFAALRAAL